MKKLTKAEYIKALEKAEKSGRDKIGIIGEIGLQGLSGAGSAAAASALLTTAVTTTSTVTAPVLGSTFLGSLVGANAVVASTAIVAAPVAAVAAAGVGGLAASYFLIKLAKDGWKNDKRRSRYIKELREKITQYEDASHSIDDNSKLTKLAGIHATLLKLNIITVEKSQKIFDGIQKGLINTDFAMENARQLLNEINN
jgi:hypothetical protein